MRLVATEYLTFDGVFAELGRWSGPFFNPEAQKSKMPGTGEFGVKMLHPVVLGAGRRLFAGQVAKRALELIETRRFSSGIVILGYRAKSS